MNVAGIRKCLADVHKTTDARNFTFKGGKGAGWLSLFILEQGVMTIYRHCRSRPAYKAGADLPSGYKPRPKGWLLAHGVALQYDKNGLYHFYIPPDDGWVRCRCGWRTDLGPHYAHPDVACKNASLLDLMDKIY